MPTPYKNVAPILFTKLLLLSALLTLSVPLMAQGSGELEEVIVTAQRRVQSLQEVPISISTVSAADIIKQGFRELEDIESFSPSVNIEANLHDTSITVRGMGNDVANMSVEQSAPIFVDGVVFGRGSMINTAFLDLERIEVLKGPQPVYFGQNAVAGAFSVTTKKPTPEWEGNLTAEIGNFSRNTLEGGVGGPINDTWGIRLAGQYDKTDGHLRDMFTGDPFPYRRDVVGRVMLQWQPSDRFQALFKMDYMKRDQEGDPNIECAVPGELKYDETAIIQRGLVPAWDALWPSNQGLTYQLRNCADDGFAARIGFKEGTKVRMRNLPGYNNADTRSGTIDISEVLPAFKESIGVDPSGEARDNMHATDFLINLTYEFDNGVQLEANSGMIDYLRRSYEDNEVDPFWTDDSNRTEKFDMWSQELRLHSPAGGMIEWDVGAYYQTESLDLDPAIVIRPHLRTPVRYFHPWGDSTWKSVFGNFTYNFWGNKASLDLGGRLTDVHKFGGSTAEGATYIFNIDPVNPATGTITSTEYRHASQGGNLVRTLTFATGPARNAGGPIINCGTNPIVPQILISTGDASFPGDVITASSSPCGEYAGVPGYYTSRYNNQEIPDMWQGQSPVAFSPLLTNFSNQPGPFLDTIDDTSFDPQVTLRYRPTENISMYAKWAQAFKAGGFDTSDRAMPNGGIGTSIGQEEWSYDAENAEIFEFGGRGTALENRLRWGITLFKQEIVGLQVETATINLEQAILGLDTSNRGQTNQGTQITKGIDFDATWLAMEGLVLKLAGVVQKGEMQDFIAGCTNKEFFQAATNDCISFEESADLLGLNVGDPGADALAGFIDRAGQQAPRTPKWKVILGMNYEKPFLDRYKYTFDTNLGLSASYTEDTLGYSYTVSWDAPVPKWNMNLGVASIDDRWQVNVWMRNILGTIQQYHLEDDLDPQGITGLNAGPSNFFTYGLQVGYQF